MLFKNHHQETYFMQKNILVTGSHRSGSTWTGKVLAASGETIYIPEPFNILNNKHFLTPLKYWFEYIGKDEKRQEAFSKFIKDRTHGSLNALRTRISKASYQEIPHIVSSEWMKYRNRRKRKIVRDPMAIFSADVFAEKMNYKVLILIRHPAAFAESLKSKNWFFDFTAFTLQKELMADVLSPFASQIKKILSKHKSEQDIIEHAILLWNIIYSRVLHYQNKFPNWLYIKHETLSLHPIQAFQKIFQQLELNFNDQVKEHLLKTTQAQGTVGSYRNAQKNSQKWTTKLSQEEIHRIYEGTKSVAKHFYSTQDWFNTVMPQG